MADQHDNEVGAGQRFEFGKNWQKFLTVLNEERIVAAERSLQEMLRTTDLRGKTFLDVGSGSGLFSLAARRLQARVYSFDYDPQSVACTRELKRRHCPADEDWRIGRGSVLDVEFLESLGTFDIVYSWGVLHHTGAMWEALANVVSPVAEGGRLFIAIYNDQGKRSARWTKLKKFYNALPASFRIPFVALLILPGELKALIKSVLTLRPRNYVELWTGYKGRGMSRWYDMVDWVGGYPFEVAKPEEIFYFYQARGFVLDELKTCGAFHGCNQFVFHRIASSAHVPSSKDRGELDDAADEA